MNRIVQFPAQRVVPSARKHETAPAEIVIFPGVRIERQVAEKSAGAALARKRRSAQVAVDQDVD
jgi:hypothetical protein